MEFDQPSPVARFKTFFISRIPLGKSETHLQSIFSFHFPGALISLSLKKRKSRKKASFMTGTLMVPIAIINSNKKLEDALTTSNGVPIDVSPLGKIFFKLKTEKQSSEAELEQLKADMCELKASNESLKIELQEQRQQTRKLQNEFNENFKRDAEEPRG
eukprot:UN25227